MSGWALTMPEDLNNHSNLEQSNVSNFYGIEGEIETHCLKFLHYKIVKDSNFKQLRKKAAYYEEWGQML